MITDKLKDRLIEMLVEHSRIMYAIMSDMGVFYVAWAENSNYDKDILEKKATNLKFDIEEAASIKNQAIKDFSEVITLGSGDWVILMQKMDGLSNLALKFIELLMYIELKNVDSEMKRMYHKSINEILEMAKLLEESIKLLRENRSNVIFNINKIHELGNSTDKIVHQFLHYIYKDKELEIRNLLIIRDSIITLEKFVEKINHLAEIIRVLHYE
ncbi:MAG: hypothetical protein ACFFDF_05915 [Candidatus Odinarchaeota archaeon]